MIVDLNLYRNNRGLRLLDPSKGLPPEAVLGCLYESVGLEPWSGPRDSKGKPGPEVRRERLSVHREAAAEGVRLRWQ